MCQRDQIYVSAGAGSVLVLSLGCGERMKPWVECRTPLGGTRMLQFLPEITPDLQRVVCQSQDTCRSEISVSS